MTYQAQNGEDPRGSGTTGHSLNILSLLLPARAGWRVTPVRKESPMRFRMGGVALVVLWILCIGCEPSVHPRQARGHHCLDLDQSRSQGVCLYRERIQGLGQFICYLVAGSVDQAAVARVQPERSE